MSANETDASLAGRHVVLAGARKGEEFTVPLERRGARVTVAAALSYVDLADDADLHTAIAEVIERRPDVLLVTTGVGWRGVLAAADGLGRQSKLVAACGDSYVVARGAKARGGVVGSGLTPNFVATSETSAEVIDHLKTLDLTGKFVAVQHHGSGSQDLDDAVAAGGGAPIDLIAYRTAPPPDPQAVTDAISQVIAGQVDVIAFTSAPLFDAYLDAARSMGAFEEFVAALRDGRCRAAGFGELTVKPMQALGLDPLIPERSRLGALVKTVAAYLHDADASHTNGTGGGVA